MFMNHADCGQKVILDLLTSSDKELNPSAETGDQGIIVRTGDQLDYRRCWVYVPKKQKFYSLMCNRLALVGTYSWRQIYNIINTIKQSSYYKKEKYAADIIISNLKEAATSIRNRTLS